MVESACAKSIYAIVDVSVQSILTLNLSIFDIYILHCNIDNCDDGWDILAKKQFEKVKRRTYHINCECKGKAWDDAGKNWIQPCFNICLF
jgi:hypothetical protein